jgi:hypothetical protein
MLGNGPRVVAQEHTKKYKHFKMPLLRVTFEIHPTAA